ncbi:D-Ala-D-Ala carboxypeptidase family metallohydrolase [Microbulbifer marinus]|uniref:Peptidase M15 n=1 Tax=Microbulbifer marinus TaxID=658218 RepID=A0A1H3YSD5_9GAMM|nr:D-Ala-D-Ala carboxypeptidase family metallohydrolase [Microbulbifer marinus]SEA14469.1 Peptidase M15 [Microbulbifer marinus]
MSAGNSYSRYRTGYPQSPPGQRTNRLVVVGLALLLLLVVVLLWLYLYLKSLEKPYVELKGYRVATMQSFSSFLRRGSNRARVAELTRFLEREGVDNVTAVQNLLRQGTDWLDIDEPPFAIPPSDQWRNIVATLAVLRDEVEPMIGGVDVVSAYRTDNYNRKSGGASRSKHRDFCGLDLVPKSNISRKELIEELRSLHRRLGPKSNLGLGIYHDVRFHIDTCGYRTW